MLKMAITPLFAFFFLTHLVLPSSGEEHRYRSGCQPFDCGNLGKIFFPFNNMTNPECGVVTVNCSENISMIQFKERGHWYKIGNISQADVILVNETVPLSHLKPFNHCQLINDFSLPSPILSSVFSFRNLARVKPSKLYNCKQSLHIPPVQDFNQTKCGEYDFYCNSQDKSFPFEQQCPNATLPFSFPLPPTINLTFEVLVNPECYECRRGRCGDNRKRNRFQCILSPEVSGLNDKQKLGVGLGVGFGGSFAIMGLAVIMWRRKHKRAASRGIDDPYMNMEDPEGASGHLGVIVFTYKDLTEATNNFDADRELGDGGFGTVYYGKLKDGREVAVKRLYEHNYKRLEQFINEIKILTRLRHKNLVSLYGCTSRRSRELLLVYEYISNGTVADHLHGDRAKNSPLTWPVRLSVAIETASALAYLHASEIIHRDVKTNNILLDENFCVKVADFGLSRLFPNDVTHVSTAPQGTPGYVDPEYHQCYQLTSKSDVYSFGVVLVELLSSMPAVDITRHRHEINLSNLAISKIQKQAYNELIDQGLGFDSDIEVRTMTVAVAELAFECLQQDKEMRPTMDEVLERLMRIEDRKIETRGLDNSGLSVSTVKPMPPPSPECDEIGLLKNREKEPPPSPNDVTENWPSTTSTTPNFSG